MAERSFSRTAVRLYELRPERGARVAVVRMPATARPIAVTAHVHMAQVSLALDHKPRLVYSLAAYVDLDDQGLVTRAFEVYPEDMQIPTIGARLCEGRYGDPPGNLQFVGVLPVPAGVPNAPIALFVFERVHTDAVEDESTTDGTAS